MGRAMLAAVAELSGRLAHWRSRELRAEARELKAQHGDQTVSFLRQLIAEADRYEDRRRLYRLHDEIARGLSSRGLS